MSNSKMTQGPTYQPQIFEVNDLEAVMQIILTPERGITTRERWEYETPYLVDEIGRARDLDGNSCVLDYGCGIGRIAKGLIERMITQGFRATHACACWVIQHCLAPDTDLARIDSALAGNGKLFVLNNKARCVPTDRGWASDGLSVEDLLTVRFEKIAQIDLPKVITTPEIAN